MKSENCGMIILETITRQTDYRVLGYMQKVPSSGVCSVHLCNFYFFLFWFFFFSPKCFFLGVVFHLNQLLLLALFAHIIWIIQTTVSTTHRPGGGAPSPPDCSSSAVVHTGTGNVSCHRPLHSTVIRSLRTEMTELITWRGYVSTPFWQCRLICTVSLRMLHILFFLPQCMAFLKFLLQIVVFMLILFLFLLSYIFCLFYDLV